MRALLATLGLCWAMALSAAPKADLWPYWQTADRNSTAVVDHSQWQRLLDIYLDAEHASGVNRFNYAAVSQADAKALQNYIQTLQNLDPLGLNRNEQKAYWINLYNAHTVQLVLDAYPVKSILKVRGGIFGRGPWDKKTLEITGQKLGLNDIEHRILRPIWQDPRIHFAVNCASIGCPNLLPQVFTAATTETFLEQAAREYLAHPRGLAFDNSALRLSKIFAWYQSDFGSNDAQMLRFLQRYATADSAKRLENFSGDIEYHYDWNLNQPE